MNFQLDDDPARLRGAADPRRDGAGISVPIALSIALHVLVVTWAVTRVPPMVSQKPLPIGHYVELMRRQPFTEAPGPKVATASLEAPYGSANRRASAPSATGTVPSERVGDGSTYVPGARGESGPEALSRPSASRSQPQDPSSQSPQQANATEGAINWRSAIREAGRIASLGEAGDFGSLGGERGFAESGPVSFATQWYDWGEYAEGMVRRIRVHWYENMPHLIRTGMKGVVVIRFTILRSGAITNIEIVSSSNVPPYDFAAKKALELASPLAPLPRDFPNDREEVTAQFFYNSTPRK